MIKIVEQFILTQFAILIPTLFGIGKIIKHTKLIDDKFIPILLAMCGVLLSVSINGLNSESVIQGILIATSTVWSNETVKQLSK